MRSYFVVIDEKTVLSPTGTSPVCGRESGKSGDLLHESECIRPNSSCHCFCCHEREVQTAVVWTQIPPGGRQQDLQFFKITVSLKHASLRGVSTTV